MGIGSESGQAKLKADNKEYAFEAKLMPNSAGTAELKYIVYDTANKSKVIEVNFTFEATPLGLESKTSSMSLRTYPNPVISELNIDIEYTQEISLLQILDSKGIEYFKESISSTKYNSQIPMASFNNGIYVILIKNTAGKVITTKKILKLNK